MVTSENLPPDDFSKGKDDFRKESPIPQSTRGWLTREESARLLNVSSQTIKNYEKRGQLRPLRETREDPRGRKYEVVVYDPRELLQARKDTTEAVDTSTWLTRNDAVSALSISTQTLKNYEKRGLLRPRVVRRQDKRKHEQSLVVYDPKELAKLPRGVGRAVFSRESGELAARCFELFEEGTGNREIVIKLRVTPDEVRDLRERWLDEGGSAITITREAKEALEALIGPFAGIADLVTLVTEKLSPEP